MIDWQRILTGIGNGVDLSNAVKLPTVEVATDKKTNQILIATASILAAGLVLASIINRGK